MQYNLIIIYLISNYFILIKYIVLIDSYNVDFQTLITQEELLKKLNSFILYTYMSLEHTLTIYF